MNYDWLLIVSHNYYPTDPNLAEKGKVDPELAKKLQHVYLTSTGVNPEIVRKQKQTLPKDRENHLEFEYGYDEPKVIPEGRATFRQIVEFLGKHHNDPQNYTIEKIAEEYKISIKDVTDILENFKPFQVYSPPQEKPSASPFMRALKP